MVQVKAPNRATTASGEKLYWYRSVHERRIQASYFEKAGKRNFISAGRNYEYMAEILRAAGENKEFREAVLLRAAESYKKGESYTEAVACFIRAGKIAEAKEIAVKATEECGSPDSKLGQYLIVFASTKSGSESEKKAAEGVERGFAEWSARLIDSYAYNAKRT